MPLMTDAGGLVWLEPKHIDVKTIEADVLATSIDATTAKYGLTPAEWREVAEGVGQMYHNGAGVQPALLNAVVNLRLPLMRCASPPTARLRTRRISTRLCSGPFQMWKVRRRSSAPSSSIRACGRSNCAGDS